MDICREILGPHTSTQALMEELGKKDNFYLDFQKDDGFKFTQLFYNYRKSQQMLKENPNILIINTIYKMNQYNLSYIDMTGQIMIGIFFFIGFFFIDKEDNADYNWLMGCLKALYNKLELLYPYVIVTDN